MRKKIIVFDLDGTLAEISHRLKHINIKPKDYNKFFTSCHKDKPIQWMIDLVKQVNRWAYEVWVVTGRNDSTEQMTREWLVKHGVDFDVLRMRKDGDYRHDTEVKPELIEDVKERVEFIVEDRNSVVKKWRELGFNVLQCAEGDF